ncbi:tRNA pseudouridine(38-40) synthase TruA [Treponema sp.]
MSKGSSAPERNIRLTLAYDGTDFAGWQRQKSYRSVQGEIEKALEKIHKKPIALYGSGRTDSGVHAAGQVAHFKTPSTSMEASRFVLALNSLLDRDIRVLEAREASPDFHARFDAKSRFYRYRLICGRSALPHELRYAYQLWRRPNLNHLNRLARTLLGETDCSTFATPKDPSESRYRHIMHARFFAEGEDIIFEIAANAFLYRMVRSVVGSLLFYESEGLSPEDFRAIVVSHDRSLAGPTAPAQGLFLWRIEYFRD